MSLTHILAFQAQALKKESSERNSNASPMTSRKARSLGPSVEGSEKVEDEEDEQEVDMKVNVDIKTTKSTEQNQEETKDNEKSGSSSEYSFGEEIKAEVSP